MPGRKHNSPAPADNSAALVHTSPGPGESPVIDSNEPWFQIWRTAGDSTQNLENSEVSTTELARLRLVVASSCDAIYDWRFDADTFWQATSEDAFLGALHPAGELWWRSQIHPADLPRVLQSLRQFLAGASERWCAQYRWLNHGGEYLQVQDTALLTRSAGQPLRLTGTLREFTSPLLSETVLQEADPLLQDILDHCAAFIFVKDLCGRYIYVNQHWETLVERDLSETLGQTDEALFGPAVAARLRANDEEVLKRGEPVELEEQVPKGDELRSYIVVKYPLRDAQGEIYALCGVATDITEQTRVAEQLRESESRYRLLAEYSFDMITRHAIDGTYLYVSPACEGLLGYTPEEMVGSDPFTLMHPDDIGAVRQLHYKVITDQDDPRVLCCRLRRKDGTYIWTEALIHVIRDPQTRQILDVIGTSRDITERKRAEVAVRRAGRMASIGTLAAGIAHEINNPIGAAWTSAEAALAVKDDPAAGPLLEECLKNVIQSVRRCGDIVRNVLRFSRHQALEKPLSDLNDIVRRAYDACRTYAQRRGAVLEMELAADLPPVNLNPLEMEQVVANLVRNAIESGEQVRVIIFTEHSPKGVTLKVRDNGRGLSESERGRIFEPFYTLREKEGGTGLGLSVVYGIVEEHGGTIRVDSEPQQGATLTVFIPFQAPSDAPQRTQSADGAAR